MSVACSGPDEDIFLSKVSNLFSFWPLQIEAKEPRYVATFVKIGGRRMELDFCVPWECVVFINDVRKVKETLYDISDKWRGHYRCELTVRKFSEKWIRRIIFVLNKMSTIKKYFFKIIHFSSNLIEHLNRLLWNNLCISITVKESSAPLWYEKWTGP